MDQSRPTRKRSLVLSVSRERRPTGRSRVQGGGGSLAMRIDGGCHCGYFAYEGEADPEKTAICHCTDCQHLSGSSVSLAKHSKSFPVSRPSM
ncbi:MAG: GFA family protein [Xanthobacteraceae bacterium]